MYDVFCKFPEFDLAKSKLRQLQLSDLCDFYEYLNHDKVKLFLSDAEIPLNIQEAKKELLYWRNLFINENSIYWGIADKYTNKLIGACGFNLWSIVHKRVELSYDLSYDYWNCGIMTEALCCICDFSFEKMRVNRVQATVAIDNFSSIRVLEKVGLFREGKLKSYNILGNMVKDFYMYGVDRWSRMMI